MPSPELVIGGGLLLMLILGKKKEPDVTIQPFPNPPDDEEPDWGEGDVMDMHPQVGDFWHWNDLFVDKLPLIYRPGDRRLMGVYNPVKSDNYLIAVVDSSVMENGRYLVVATSAISGFPANHPQA